MKTYIDYEFYKSLGGKIPQGSFDRYAIRATKYVDYNTFNRIEEVTEEIKLATCEVADLIYKSNLEGDREIQSESVGSHSVTYSTSNKTIEQKAYDILKMYLDSDLLYRGV
ncbi:TPA: hypothetical protein KOS69_003207 [Clostridioides difficile]|uniref:hypothetical protein n=1 Tax=Clostridioides difficile TaxID=1496 RepID=UPI00097FF945|nr:hypothetical protein [Clostridioides difficile]MDV9794252.1 hypothetical protein [Clostridioides difficile]MDV9989330.1 hypothetical protein [Clostridioides difficile]PBF40863.1 hypothetical protein BGU48_10915 [Clostridioides difficile]SJR59881.1 Uncharacterised protein [Clostridioides difficile]SJS03714.1 Uncharacterised protein [Clostridioides difficile]